MPKRKLPVSTALSPLGPREVRLRPETETQPEAAPPFTHDAGELIVIAGSAVPPGMPNDEGGPRAWPAHFFGDGVLTAGRVAQVALLQLARHPSHRPILNHRHQAVFVFSDRPFSTQSRQAAPANECRAIGTFTEAARLVKRVTWIQPRMWFTPQDIVELAVNEVELARREDPTLAARGVLLLLWKADRKSFGGAAALQIGRAICDGVFTLGSDQVPPFLDCDIDDGTG